MEIWLGWGQPNYTTLDLQMIVNWLIVTCLSSLMVSSGYRSARIRDLVTLIS